MQFATTVTQKGQATIPVLIRKRLGINPNTKIVFELADNHVILRPATDFFSLKGSVKSTKPFDINAMEKATMDALITKYVKKPH